MLKSHDLSNDRVTFYRVIPTGNCNCGPNSDTDEVELWASVTANSSGESTQADQVRNQTTYTIQIRYNTTITPDMRILWRGRELYITGILSSDNFVTTITAMEDR